MKIYLIKASAGSSFSEYKKETGGPPQNIFSTAAATPEGVEIEMADETIGMKTDFYSDADVVAIFMSTPDALRAYEIADKFKSQGKTIVLGGLHTKFMQEEALKHADALLLGEPEEIWEQLLEDYKNGELKEKYERETPFDLSKLKPYPTNIIHPKEYNYTWSVVVSRGCPNRCDFCLVHKFFDKFQLRPIGNIVNEVKELKKLGVHWIELHSDNLTANRQYALDLFKALAPLKMKFYGETTILMAKNDELLEAAQKAGVKAFLFGIETSSEEALKAQGKSFVKPEDVKEYVRKLKRYGIEVWGDFLFGFDEHDNTIFEETVDYVKKIKIDRVFPHLVIPFPGSEYFKKLDKERRILTKDWSKYDGSHSVFQPKKMTPKELEDGVYWIWLKQYGKIANFLYSLSSSGKKRESKASKKKSNIRWKTLIAITLVLLALYYNFSNVVFGILFLLWSIYGILSRRIYFVEEINRNQNPILFWIVSIMWVTLSAMWIFYK